MLTDNVRASMLMIATMAGFALEDLCIKILSTRMPVGEVLLLLGIGGLSVMWILARIRGVSLLDPLLLARPVMLRNCCEITTQIFGFAALAVLPLSTVTSIGQAAPIASTLGAALFLREPVGWRRWTAVGVGMIGVLLILSPGSAQFHPAMILSGLAVISVATRDLATRRVPTGLTILQLNFWGYFAPVPAGLFLLVARGELPVMPLLSDAWLILLTVALGVVFYGTLTVALRIGESSVVVPYRYTRLVFVLILAAIFLGERPTLTMLAGTALVMAAGLYTLWRETQLKRRARRQAAAAVLLKPSPDPAAPL